MERETGDQRFGNRAEEAKIKNEAVVGRKIEVAEVVKQRSQNCITLDTNPNLISNEQILTESVRRPKHAANVHHKILDQEKRHTTCET